jgi:AraC-like DNA-binding protein
LSPKQNHACNRHQDIAHYLSRTTRTLHRQLKQEQEQEQTSWRQVRDEVCKGIAEELLSKPMKLDEIAERLGFSDGANFSHRFKRCKNITPSRHRKQIQKQVKADDYYKLKIRFFRF